MRIYAQFLKYIVASVASLVIDISLFALLVQLLKGVTYEGYIYIATVAARAISSFVNFLINRNAVFKAKNATRRQSAKQFLLYYLLVVVNLAVSSVSVNCIVKRFLWNETFVKICVDTAHFFFNFIIQNKFIFKARKKTEK